MAETRRFLTSSGGFGVLSGCGHQPQAEDGAGRADDTIEAAANDLIDVGAHLAIEMLDEATFVGFGERIALGEALGQPDDADLEALAERHAFCGAERNLDAATADVDDDSRGRSDVDAVAGSEVDEPSLFRARDHADANASLPIDFGDEVAAVVGFAGRARGAGDDLVDLVRLGDATELGQRLEGGGYRRWRQAAAAEPAGAKPDHILFPVDDLKRQVGTNLNHDHMDRVGTDIDGGDAHAGRLAGLARACSVTRPLYTGGTGPSLLLYWPFFSKLSAILP